MGCAFEHIAERMIVLINYQIALAEETRTLTDL